MHGMHGMKLYVLKRGKSKARMQPVMIDSQKKCENYRDALKASDIKKAFYSIEIAPAGSNKWQKNRTNKWTGYNVSGPKVHKRKAGKGDKFGA